MDANTFKQVMNESFSTVKDYVKFQEEENSNELNPFTQIRHALYLYDKTNFPFVLYNHQRTNFETWLKDHQNKTQQVS